MWEGVVSLPIHTTLHAYHLTYQLRKCRTYLCGIPAHSHHAFFPYKSRCFPSPTVDFFREEREFILVSPSEIVSSFILSFVFLLVCTGECVRINNKDCLYISFVLPLFTIRPRLPQLHPTIAFVCYLTYSSDKLSSQPDCHSTNHSDIVYCSCYCKGNSE